MAKTSLSHRGLSVAYFSFEVHRWLGMPFGCQSIDLHFQPIKLRDQNGKNVDFTPWAKPCLFQLRSALLGECFGDTYELLQVNFWA